MKLAVIPARGGSKRIPRKNIRDFAGKPLIAYSISLALGCELFDRIIVSTDDEEIADISLSLGAEVPFRRPDHLADDFTGTTEVIAHAIRGIAKDEASELSAVCCIYPTAPFIQAEDLSRGLDLLLADDWQYVFAATSFSSPIFRSFSESPDGGVKMFFPDKFQARSQDLPTALHDAGQFYWGRKDAWLEKKRIFENHSRVVYVPRWRVQDIDSDEDWQRAEQIAALLQSRAASSSYSGT